MPTYAHVFEALGRRMRPEWTVDDLAVSLTALVQGLLMRAVVDPDSVHDSTPDGVERWSFFARVALELVFALSEPVVSDADRRVVFDVAEYGEPAPQLVLTAGDDGKLDIELHWSRAIEDGRIAVEFSIDDCVWSVPLSSDPAKALWRGRMPWNGTPLGRAGIQPSPVARLIGGVPWPAADRRPRAMFIVRSTYYVDHGTAGRGSTRPR